VGGGAGETNDQCITSKGNLFDMLCDLAYVKNESRSTAPSRLIDARNLLQPFEESNNHFLSFRRLKIGTFSSFTVKRPVCH